MTDELKPVNCGCGGEAIIYINGARQAKIYCEKCGIESNVFATKYEAITAWNRAMGERTAKVVHKSDTYVVTPPKTTTASYETRTNLWEECGNCHAMGMYHGWNYCPKCGVKLDWSEHE